MRLSLYISLIVLFISGCATVNVQYDYDETADFNTIRTYGWKNASIPDDALEANPLLKKRVERSINNHLQNKGFTMITDEIPDFYVVAHAGIQEKMRVTNTGGPAGYYPDPWYSPWWGGGAHRVDVHYYTEGTLVIDIVNAKQNELIWRGSGTGIVKNYDSQEKMQQAVDEYVNKILEGFPPGMNK